MTLKNYLKEVILHLEFQSILELIGDFSNFDNIVKSKFANQYFLDENPGKNKIRFYENVNINKMELKDSSLTLYYNGELFNNYESFLEDLELIIKALKALSVKMISSIHLRYVNEIAPKNKIDDWNEWINPDLHNFKFVPQNSGIIRSLNRAEYKIDEFNLIFQYGQFNLNYPSTVIKNDFILDYECLNNNPESVNDLADIVVKMDAIISDFYNESIGEILK